jgi:hypothetical protein
MCSLGLWLTPFNIILAIVGMQDHVEQRDMV